MAELWAFIATQFADHPGVAGYDLLNEPGNGNRFFSTRRGLTAFFRDAIAAIRTAETEVGGPGHIIFFEPSVLGIPPAFTLSGDNLVFAPHNYFESIVSGPEGLLDFSFWLYDLLGRVYDTTLWCGEFGSFNDIDTNEAWMARFAALEDEYLFSGGAWWQWEQECGDPHDVNNSYPPSPDWVLEQKETCGDARMEPTLCAGRAYPRAVPGRLTSLEAAPCGQTLRVIGSTQSPGVADLWIPSASENMPVVNGTDVQAVSGRRVEGGWRLEVAVTGEYEIEVTP